MAVFEVVAMALAPERHVAAFVDHFRRKGAARVRVYFDSAAAPAPPATKRRRAAPPPPPSRDIRSYRRPS